VVSERALQEIYFPAFRAAVVEGQVASVMCAYPQVNDLYACQNPYLLGTLKNAWGFLGYVGPDAILAVRDTLAAIDAGTDNFQLGTLLGDPPAQVLDNVPDEKLDDMVRRILTAMFSVGIFDYPNTGDPNAVVTSAAHRALAADVAAAGTVLLKNDAGALPLGADVQSIAVIGYDAGPATQNMEGGSPAVIGGPVVTPLDAITARAGQGVTVTHADGTLGLVSLPVLPAAVLTPSSGSGPGLFGTYYPTMDWNGSPVDQFVSPTIDANAVLVSGSYSARWTGTLTPQVSGLHRFSMRHTGIARLYIDGQLIASGETEALDGGHPGVAADHRAGDRDAHRRNSRADRRRVLARAVHHQHRSASRLAATGRRAPGRGRFRRRRRRCGGRLRQRRHVGGHGPYDAGAAGRSGRAHRGRRGGEPAHDRRLHTSGAVLMPWLPQVAAVLQAWYPGETSGTSIAAVLFGDAEPGGRLPMTFPADATQGPGTLLAQYPGVGGEVHYDEGIDVGYRYYDRFVQEPLFPFGYGLSYSSFNVDRLRVRRRRGTYYGVRARVTNTGSRAATTVVQLYVGFPASTGEPPNQLKAFAKVALQPGRRKRVRFLLDSSAFATWSTADAEWVVYPGDYAIRVGMSSRDLPEEAVVTLPIP
jgi:beta-glucosidase